MTGTTNHQAYDALSARFRRIALLGDAEGMLHWDYAAIMPQGGANARAEQLAELGAIAHGILTANETGDLIARATDETPELSEWQVANLNEISKKYRRAHALDEEFVTTMARAKSACEQAWRDARAQSDFAIVEPTFTVLLDLVREEAKRIGDALELDPLDALMDAFEPGARQANVDPVFDELTSLLPDFLEAILAKQQAQPEIIRPKGPFPTNIQRDVGLKFMETLGFDFDRGRLDVSHHPFCGGIPDDVRITTRYDEDDFTSALMGVIHETGHALYEQGLPTEWRLQPVGNALGMSMHESQSLLMEMQVCRSPEFLEYAIPIIRDAFKGTGPAWETENLIRLYHDVSRSFIRVDADEVTYPLHVIVRYRLEKQIIAGELQARDIPSAWNAMFKDLVGVDVPHDAHGALQDIHWYDGGFGYFPTYTLGAMTAAQIYQSAKAAMPHVEAEIGQGNFTSLVRWLRDNVHGHGRRLSTDDLLTQATGRPLQTSPFIDHLRARYLPE